MKPRILESIGFLNKMLRIPMFVSNKVVVHAVQNPHASLRFFGFKYWPEYP